MGRQHRQSVLRMLIIRECNIFDQRSRLNPDDKLHGITDLPMARSCDIVRRRYEY